MIARESWDGSQNDFWTNIENATGSAFDDQIWGDAGQNVLDGGAGGADIIAGNGGNDFVSYASSTSGVLIDLAAQTTWDGVNTDTLFDIQYAIGSAFADDLRGDAGFNALDGAGGADTYFGGGSGDLFIFKAGEAQGDSVVDFAAGSDKLEFHGYGTVAQGATFTQVDVTHWMITSADGLIHDTIELLNGATVTSIDYFFWGPAQTRRAPLTFKRSER